MEKLLKRGAEGFTSLFNKLALILLVWVGVALVVVSFALLILLPRFGTAEDWIYFFIAMVLLGGALGTAGGKATKAIWHSAL